MVALRRLRNLVRNKGEEGERTRRKNGMEKEREGEMEIQTDEGRNGDTDG